MFNYTQPIRPKFSLPVRSAVWFIWRNVRNIMNYNGVVAAVEMIQYLRELVPPVEETSFGNQHPA